MDVILLIPAGLFLLLGVYYWHENPLTTVIAVMAALGLLVSAYIGPTSAPRSEECGSGRYAWEC